MFNCISGFSLHPHNTNLIWFIPLLTHSAKAHENAQTFTVRHCNLRDVSIRFVKRARCSIRPPKLLRFGLYGLKSCVPGLGPSASMFAAILTYAICAQCPQSAATAPSTTHNHLNYDHCRSPFVGFGKSLDDALS